MQGGTIGVVRDHIKTGSTLLGKFASYGLKYYLRLFLLGLFIIFVVLIVALIAATLIVSTVPLKQAAVTVIASVIATALGIAGIYFILLLTLAPYSMVSNEAGLIAGIKNSIRVVKGSFWKILALLLLLILISLGVGFVAGFITGIVTIALPMKAGQVIIGLVNSIFNSYLGIVMIGAFMSMYLALSQTVPVASTAIPPAPPPPPPKGASV